VEKNGTIIVTGGCGYIGAHTIIEILEHTEFNVVSIDNFQNSTPQMLDRIRVITGKEVVNFEIDLCDLAKTKEVFGKFEKIVGVIHFAALKSVPDSMANPILYYRNNLDSLLNILTACSEANVPRFIFSSSCSVYGNVESLPVHEETKLNEAESPYGKSKQMGEKILEDFSKIGKTRSIALRYFNPVGAHESGLIGESQVHQPDNLVPVITQTAIGIRPSMTIFGGSFETRDGTCIRDYVHVSDIARAHVDALRYLIKDESKKTFEVFNLGTGEGVTVLEAIKAFKKSNGIELNYTVGEKREGDVASIYSNSSKASLFLGWQAKATIDDMMKSAWKWQKQLEK
jgi:UDP-glucose 4-epimerase